MGCGFAVTLLPTVRYVPPGELHCTGTRCIPERVTRDCRGVDGCASVTPRSGTISKMATYAGRLVCTYSLPFTGRASVSSSGGVGGGSGVG